MAGRFAHCSGRVGLRWLALGIQQARYVDPRAQVAVDLRCLLAGQCPEASTLREGVVLVVADEGRGLAQSEPHQAERRDVLEFAHLCVTEIPRRPAGLDVAER